MKLAKGYATPNNNMKAACIELGNALPRGFWLTPNAEIEMSFPEFFLFKPTIEEGYRPISTYWDSSVGFNDVRFVAMMIAYEIAKDTNN